MERRIAELSVIKRACDIVLATAINRRQLERIEHSMTEARLRAAEGHRAASRVHEHRLQLELVKARADIETLKRQLQHEQLLVGLHDRYPPAYTAPGRHLSSAIT